MSIIGALFGQRRDANAEADAVIRAAKWEAAIAADRMPDFVIRRLNDAAEGRSPWISTMSPAELLLSAGLGIRPVATVSATCWYHYGFSWTNGHQEGWRIALERLKQESYAAGANAIVDVKLRTSYAGGERTRTSTDMDFSVSGTAVKLDGLPPSTDPVISTVSAVEFVRLLKEGIVPTGVAIGAHFEMLRPWGGDPLAGMAFQTMPVGELGMFFKRVRQRAVQELRRDAKRLGDGVLAHTTFGQLLKIEKAGADETTGYLGRFIIIGTTVQCKAKDNVIAKFRMVLDMLDDQSPLVDSAAHDHNAYPAENDHEGAI
jgi:uncharacterized protein YbjQ (UPF0145 family)